MSSFWNPSLPFSFRHIVQTNHSSRFVILLGMGKETPAWLQQAREFCRSSQIKIVGWGPDMLTVEAKSPERAQQIASQFGQLGFKVIQDEDDAYAGLLSLSNNPAAVQAKIAAFDISRRRWTDQLVPLIWIVCSLALISGSLDRNSHIPYWVRMSIGILLAVLFLKDAGRIWGWRTETDPAALRVRRYFCWSMIPWEQISSVESATAHGRGQETVVLQLRSGAREHLGTFDYVFARCLRDRLRSEIARPDKPA